MDKLKRFVELKELKKQIEDEIKEIQNDVVEQIDSYAVVWENKLTKSFKTYYKAKEGIDKANIIDKFRGTDIVKEDVDWKRLYQTEWDEFVEAEEKPEIRMTKVKF